MRAICPGSIVKMTNDLDLEMLYGSRTLNTAKLAKKRLLSSAKFRDDNDCTDLPDTTGANEG
jgi:hypothetical protein